MIEWCHHENTEIRIWTQSNGSLVKRLQCMNCGAGVGLALKKDGRFYKRADLALAETWEQRCKREREAESAAWWQDYNEYLKTPKWAARRQHVLRRCGGVCEGCGENAAVEVHHRTYEHVSEEFLFELVGLCEGCHRRIHEKPASISNDLKVSAFLADTADLSFEEAVARLAEGDGAA